MGFEVGMEGSKSDLGDFVNCRDIEIIVNSAVGASRIILRILDWNDWILSIFDFWLNPTVQFRPVFSVEYEDSMPVGSWIANTVYGRNWDIVKSDRRTKHIDLSRKFGLLQNLLHPAKMGSYHRGPHQFFKFIGDRTDAIERMVNQYDLRRGESEMIMDAVRTLGKKTMNMYSILPFFNRRPAVMTDSLKIFEEPYLYFDEEEIDVAETVDLIRALIERHDDYWNRATSFGRDW
ncbi:hypothetical protein AAG570_008341 [Ranatra chinensis]|uniref:Uncharacterized protein n=1 Tax=Ranatra chinensis TaxID=642074 RepID=A0ABD0YEN6_9HEMI